MHPRTAVAAGLWPADAEPHGLPILLTYTDFLNITLFG